MSKSAVMLYDTMSRKKCEMKPADGKLFKYYCCGPTVYGPAHIGNFRTFVVQDLFRRVLELSGVKTKHVRNITDVDDKTIRGAQEEGVTLDKFTSKWADKFHIDCDELNLLPPHEEPSAVCHLSQQIKMIELLVERGHAYQGSDGSVYYSVESFEGYGKLSNLENREVSAGASQRVDSDEYDKDSVADFVLWKARKEEDGDNFWESPWGEGRPGWHLECSAMCHEHLGATIDLHSGGVDLTFPHHENEIAQSEGAWGQKFSNYWFHITHLMVDGGKMSKSLGNLYTLSDIKEKGYSAADLRYALLMGHYSKPLNFTFQSLDTAKQAIKRLRKLSDNLSAVVEDSEDYAVVQKKISQGLIYDFGVFTPAWESLLDDLNTAEALGRVFTVVGELEKKISSKTLDATEAGPARFGLFMILEAFGFILPEEERVEVPAEVQELAEKRLQAKKDKDYALADQLRDEIKSLGWQVKDAPGGYTVEPL